MRKYIELLKSKIPYSIKNNFHISLIFLQIGFLFTLPYSDKVFNFAIGAITISVLSLIYFIKKKVIIRFLSKHSFTAFSFIILLSFINNKFFNSIEINIAFGTLFVLSLVLTFGVCMCSLALTAKDIKNSIPVQNIKIITNKEPDLFISNEVVSKMFYKVDNNFFTIKGLMLKDYTLTYKDIFDYMKKYNRTFESMDNDDFEIINIINN